MRPAKLLHINILAIALILCFHSVRGQVLISGTIYDHSQRYVLQGVSVMGTSGAGTMTDSLGHYQIRLPINDSIYFSYLGKPTTKFSVKNIPPTIPFDLSMDVKVESLPSVLIQRRNYRLDSLENRREYQKVFDYEPDYLSTGNAGVGFNLDLLFSAKKNRQMLSLQKRLEEEERDKYIDHRFNRMLVHKITGLESPAIDSFMRQYRPTYEFIQGCENEYEFYNYIQKCGKFFYEDWKMNHPNDPH